MDATGPGAYPTPEPAMARINITAVRRQQIIDATIRVMAARGWNETSIDEITREAGVSRGLVSYHFKDKAQLLSGVLASCQDTFAATVADAIAASPNPLDQVRSATRSAVLMARDHPAPYEVFLHFSASARSDPDLAEQVRGLYRGFRRAIADGIRRGQASGHFRQVDPDTAAARHVGAIVGLALQWLLDPESFDLDDAAADAENSIAALLAESPGALAGVAS
jgi:AcrR family transcriptional regulator